MCTAVTYQTKDLYFGRTLDLEYAYQEEVVVDEEFPEIEVIWTRE